MKIRVTKARLSTSITSWPGLPFIILTGHGDLENLKTFGESGILQKPYSEEDLQAMITAALK